MIFSNRYVCLLALSIEILVEHLQAMSFLRLAPDSSSTWNSEAQNLFKGLENMALRFYDSTFLGLYITAALIVFVTMTLYIAFNEKLHYWNRNNNKVACIAIWFFEHILFGIGYIPILSQFVAVQYCRSDNYIISYPEVTCWTSSHMSLLEIGYIFSGFALFLTGVIGPVFKSERKNGVERKFGNESYFIGCYKFLLMAVVFLFGPVHVPYLGIIASVVLAVYLMIYEAFAELHVASMYMGVIVAQLWVFVCAYEVSNSGYGSDMLAAWIPFFVLGYAILPIKSLIVKRVPRVIPIEKQ